MNRVALLMPDAYVNTHERFLSFLTQRGDNVWKSTQFVLNPKEGQFDGLVVDQSMQSLDRTYRLSCPRTRTLLVLKEPPDILFLPEGYTRQFYCTLGQDIRARSKVCLFSQSGHRWFVEVSIHDAITKVDYLKTKLLSAVVSSKSHTNGHRKRLHLMHSLKQHFGDRLDWFGRGIRELGDRKADALLNYKYHIVLENGSWPHYWTEKLADAFVANCYPFYWGAPNIHDYFEPGALSLIDVDDIPGTIRTIEKAIEQNLYQTAQSELAKARNKVVTQYHPYQTYLDVLNNLTASRQENIIIRPHHEFCYDFTTHWQLKINKYLK